MKMKSFFVKILFLLYVVLVCFACSNQSESEANQVNEIMSLSQNKDYLQAIEGLTEEERTRVDSIVQLPWYKESERAWHALLKKVTPIVNGLSRDEQIAFFYDAGWRDSLLHSIPSIEKEVAFSRFFDETKGLGSNERMALSSVRTIRYSGPVWDLKFSSTDDDLPDHYTYE